MLDKIKSFFKDSHPTPHFDPKKAINTAAAALLIEVMLADDDKNQEEIESVKVIMEKELELAPETIEALYKQAYNQVKEAVSLYQFTTLVNEQMDRSERVKLIYWMWKIAYADGNIDRYEEHTIRKVADLIYVSHTDFIQAKHQARDD